MVLVGIYDKRQFSFEDFQNFYEFLGYGLQITYCIMYLSTEGEETSISFSNKLHNINIFGSMLVLIRGFFLLKVLSPLRPLVRMVKEVIKTLGPFTALLFVVCFIFSALGY